MWVSVGLVEDYPLNHETIVSSGSSQIAEVLDFGYPQKTDSGILKTYITQQGVKSQVGCLMPLMTTSCL